MWQAGLHLSHSTRSRTVWLLLLASPAGGAAQGREGEVARALARAVSGIVVHVPDNQSAATGRHTLGGLTIACTGRSTSWRRAWRD